MRIAQIVVAGASEYERKVQRVDFATLSGSHEIALHESGDARPVAAAVAHVYGPAPIPAAAVASLTIPYVANAEVAQRRFTWRKTAQPNYIVTPLGPPHDLLPEAVEDGYFGTASVADRASTNLVGAFGAHRPGVRNMIEQTQVRLQRFRDDVEWRIFDRVPAPEDLAGVDAWVDPATSENDYDGFVAEALVVGKPVVAARTAINYQRLEKGRTGFLVPPGDPNELAHAILAALFKPEVARIKIDASRQTAGKFRPRQRLRVLERMFETLIL